MRASARADHLLQFIEEWCGPEYAFSSQEYAEITGLSGADASANIQAYLSKQRGGDWTGPPIQRVPGTRTKNATWRVSPSPETISQTNVEDFTRRYIRAWMRDLGSYGEQNPAQEGSIEGAQSVIEGVLKILEHSVA